MKIDQHNLKRIFDLLTEANSHNYALLPEVAKELGVKKTDLMQYVLDNPKLFHTETIWSYKEVKVKRRIWANDQKSTYTDTQQVKNRNLGLGVREVYLDPADNYRTDEWLKRMIETQAKYLRVTESDDYGHIQGYYVKLDSQDDKDEFRLHLWRNTQKKLKDLKAAGFLKEVTFTYGCWGYCYSHKYLNGITIDKINELKKQGWTFNDFKPLSR